MVLYDKLEWHLFSSVVEFLKRMYHAWHFDEPVLGYPNTQERTTTLTLYLGHDRPLSMSRDNCDSTRVTGFSPDTKARTETTAN